MAVNNNETKEIWKDIPDRFGYKASNLGRIKSFLSNKKDGKILSHRQDKDGYCMVWTKYNSADRVHRLIAKTFIDNVNDYPVVNHINGIKEDNAIENLEWCTISYNTQHGYDIGLSRSAKSEGVKVKHNGVVISVFNSVSSLGIHCGIQRNSLARCIKDGEPIYDEVFLEKWDGNHIDNPLFEKPFIDKKLDKYQCQPCVYDGVKFQSVKELCEYLKIGRYQLDNSLDRIPINSHIPKKITRYEYSKIA